MRCMYLANILMYIYLLYIFGDYSGWARVYGIGKLLFYRRYRVWIQNGTRTKIWIRLLMI